MENCIKTIFLIFFILFFSLSCISQNEIIRIRKKAEKIDRNARNFLFFYTIE